LYRQARAFALFDGVGVYVNEVGGVSLHVDTTGQRTSWGGFISHPYDAAVGRHVAVVRYTTAAEILEWIKKKLPAGDVGVGVFALIVLVYLYLVKRR
jgi:hypothetical protein